MREYSRSPGFVVVCYRRLIALVNVDVNIMWVLFPLDVSPMGDIDGDPHLLRPERDYPVWRHKLPEGYVALDEIRIEFP